MYKVYYKESYLNSFENYSKAVEFLENLNKKIFKVEFLKIIEKI